MRSDHGSGLLTFFLENPHVMRCEKILQVLTHRVKTTVIILFSRAIRNVLKNVCE